MDNSRLLVTLCTYNERDNLERLVAEIHRYAPQADVLIIDDASPDGTGELADRIARSDVRVQVLHRGEKLGLGTAMLAAIRYAIDHGYDLVLNMDADFSHHPRYIPALVECMGRADVGIGSRYVEGGGVEGWGVARRFMSRAANWYARLLLRLKARDTSGGFRCYRIARLRELDFNRFHARGYAFLQEILYRCQRIGCRFEETPIIFAPRRLGTSKVSWREVAASLWIILRLGIENLLRVPVR